MTGSASHGMAICYEGSIFPARLENLNQRFHFGKKKMKWQKKLAFCRELRYNQLCDADMAELADAPDLGSGGRPCRFESCYPHVKVRTLTLG